MFVIAGVFLCNDLFLFQQRPLGIVSHERPQTIGEKGSMLVGLIGMSLQNICVYPLLAEPEKSHCDR
jgi:hypothetical protein